MTPYLPFIAAIIIIILMVVGESTTAAARELRPSDHGLEYQSLPPTELKSPGMMSFFGAASSKSSTTTPSVALPKAMNSNDDTSSWWNRKRERKSDRLKQVLLLGSLVCGVTGVTLLVASAFIYLFKIRSSPNPNSTTNISTANSLVPISK